MSDDVYMMLVDGEVQAVDLGPMMRRHRAAHIKARADALAPMSELMGNTAFSAEEVREVMDRSGLSDDNLDAAANAALVLHEVEHGIE